MSKKIEGRYLRLIFSAALPIAATVLGCLTGGPNSNGGRRFGFHTNKEITLNMFVDWLIIAIGISVVCLIAECINEELIIHHCSKMKLFFVILAEVVIICPLSMLLVMYLIDRPILSSSQFIWPIILGACTLGLTAMFAYDSIKHTRA